MWGRRWRSAGPLRRECLIGVVLVRWTAMEEGPRYAIDEMMEPNLGCFYGGG